MATSARRATIQQHLLVSPSCTGTEKTAGFYLKSFREAYELPPHAEDNVRRVLECHELMTVTDTGHWKLRVPLMLRWLRKRG